MDRIDIKKETQGMTFAQYSQWYSEHAEQLKAQAEQDRLDRINSKAETMRTMARQFRELDGLTKYLVNNTKQFDGKVWGDKLKDSITAVMREYLTEENCPALLSNSAYCYGNKNMYIGHSYSALNIQAHISSYGQFDIFYDYEDRNTVVNKIKGGQYDGQLVTKSNVEKWTDGKITDTRDFHPSEFHGYYSNLSYFSYEGFVSSLRYNDGELIAQAEELERDAERVTEYCANLVQAMNTYNCALKDINHYAKYALELQNMCSISAPSELHYMGFSEEK